MNQQSEHLSSAQIEEYGSQASAAKPETTEWVEMHLDGCPSCRGRVLESQRTRLALFADANVNTVPTSDCPSEDDLRNLAAGLCSEPITQKLKSHAATCDHCGPLLREYSEDFSDNFTPEEQAALDQLNSASPKWQRQKAREMLKRARKDHETVTATDWRRFFSWKWMMVPVLPSVALIAVGIWYLQRDTPEKAEKYLAQAYTEQRTMEMRWPGAKWAPPKLERDKDESQFSLPISLQEAGYRISKALEKRPDDPGMLRAKAEAQLLALNYKEAIPTLEKALRFSPDAPELLGALGIAYYESAENGPAEYKQQEYGKALNNISAALKQRPNDTSLLFNRAILEAKMDFLNQAITDWERFLQLEKDNLWREEAKRHLSDVRKKQGEASSGLSDDRSPPPDFPSSTSSTASLDPETVLLFAERNFLPFIARSDTSDPKLKTTMALASEMESLHDDLFLRDMLSLIGRSGYAQATRLWTKAALENRQGSDEAAYTTAEEALKIFRRMASDAGVSAVLFEEAYSLQFQSKAAQCVIAAKDSLRLAENRKYYWLVIQSSNEAGICLNMQGQVEAAQPFFDRAILLARQHGFRSFYLRSLLQRSAFKENAGDIAGALNDSIAGLEEYFRGGIPDVRAYSFYDLITEIGERSGLDYLELGSALEQASYLPTNPNLEVDYSARFRVANIALTLGELDIAQRQFAEAFQILSQLPRTNSIRWRLLDATVGMARAQLAAGKKHEALSTLQSFSDELSHINNRYLERDYFTTLGEIKQAMGERQAANEAFVRATALADTERKSAHSLGEALGWADQNGRPYRMLTELLFDTEKPQQALALWENFRFAPFNRQLLPASLHQDNFATANNTKPFMPLPAAILTYALFPDGILIWVEGPQGRSAKKVSLPMDSFRSVATRFMDECSRPDSSISDLQADSHLLYGWLVEPVEAQLPRSGDLYIRPDGVLQILPWEVLIDDSNSYLRERYSVLIALSGNVSFTAWMPAPSDKALIVGVPGLLGVDSEISHVASAFRATTILKNNQASVKNLKREIGRYFVLHFAGHAVQQPNGPALVLVDGVFGPTETAGDDAIRNAAKPLSKLKLAVLSACSTAGSGYGRGNDTAMLVAEFLDAGAQTVIASRWNIDSDATAQFMTAFYQELRIQKKSVSDALGAVEKFASADPRHSHPYYWAAFGQFVGY